MKITRLTFSKHIILSMILLALSCFASSAQANAPIRVGIADGIFPFAVRDGGSYSGIATDIWQFIAANEKINYKYLPQSFDTNAALDALVKGSIDVVIGPVSVTHERYQHVDFSYPYFLNEVGIIQHMPSSDMRRVMNVFLETVLSPLFIWFLVFFIVYANVLWLFEKQHLHHVPKGYFKGVSHVLWVHVLQNRLKELPRTLWGRLAALVWVTAAAIFITFILATVTSKLTLTMVSAPGQFSRTMDLQDQLIAVVKDTHSVIEAQKMGARIREAKSLKQAVEWLAQGEVAGVAEDYIIAKTYLENHHYNQLQLSSLVLATDEYAIAVRKGDPLLRKINNQLLFLQGSDSTMTMCNKYIGGDDKLCRL